VSYANGAPRAKPVVPSSTLLLKRWSPIIYLKLIKKSTHSTPRADPSTRLRTSARGMAFDELKAPSRAEGLRVDTERHFLPRFKNRGLAPSNLSTYIFTSFSYAHRASGPSFRRFWSISPCPLRLTTSFSLPHRPDGLG